MAEVLISILLEQLGSAAIEKIQHEVKLVTGVEKQVEKLSSNLKAIQAVLMDAEKRQVTEEAVRDWLDKLKDVSYDADEVLDEWITRILMPNLERDKKEEQEEEGYDQPGFSTKKVCFFIPSSCFPCIRLPQVGTRCQRRDIACKIEQLNERLDVIAVEKNRFTFDTRVNHEQHARQKTTSFVDLSKVYGRDEEKKVLIRKLLSKNSSQDGRNFDIIPIVGMSGIGKTALAQLAFNDAEVQAYFDKTIWICVSEPFDEVVIAKAIIESLERRTSDKVEIQSLLLDIEHSIKDRRFLLVLDDVWTKDDRKWESIERVLANGAVGSRILVTTQKEEVVKMMRAETDKITVEVLSEEFCWDIFRRLAFYNRDEDEQLKKIGREISQKCKGVPLVAKTLGSLMHNKQGSQKWKEVLDSKLWELEDVKAKVFIPFLLSYDDLPPVEKQCLSYCSIFPKDYEIDRDDLIELWMSQGYLSRSENFEKEGRDCFENLAMRSFFQDFVKDYEGNVIRCKMHDIMHDFVLFLMQNEYCTLDVNDADHKERMGHEKKKFRHAALLLERGANIPSSLYKSKNKSLRTLVATSSYSTTSSVSELFSKLTCVRTLNLSKCKFDRLPESINNLLHLRYLNLSDNPHLKELPNSLYDLLNLQTLKMLKCPILEELPEGIQRLVNLRHLYCNRCVKLLYLPKGVRKLTCLRTLDMFVVPENDSIRNKEAMKLEDLDLLKHLQCQYLHIAGCGNLLNGGQAKRSAAQLLGEEEYNLVHLKLTFNSANDKAHGDILEALQPHPYLKALKIISYQGSTINPKWMLTLVNLKRLKLDCCYNCKTLPPLGKLPSLESLYVGDLQKVETVGLEFLGLEEDKEMKCESSFPKLKLLQFARLHEWTEWKGGVCVMPSLHSLEISWCESLKLLPDFLWRTPLQNLTISYCKNINEEHCRRKLKLFNHNIPNIKFMQ